MRKPRGDSVLKTLPEDRQRSVVEYASGHTLAETVAWLAQDAITTSSAALSEFLSWWHLQHQFRAHASDMITMIDLLRKRRPDLPESDLESYASEFFQLQAIKDSDPKTFLAIATARHRAEMDKARLDQRERALQFDKDKFRESIKDNIERGLDALYEEIRHEPEAVDLFVKLKGIVYKEADAAT